MIAATWYYEPGDQVSHGAGAMSIQLCLAVHKYRIVRAIEQYSGRLDPSIRCDIVYPMVSMPKVVELMFISLYMPMYFAKRWLESRNSDLIFNRLFSNLLKIELFCKKKIRFRWQNQKQIVQFLAWSRLSYSRSVSLQIFPSSCNFLAHILYMHHISY